MQSCDPDDDEVDLVFVEEPGFVYKIPVLPNLVSSKLRIRKVEYDYNSSRVYKTKRGVGDDEE